MRRPRRRGDKDAQNRSLVVELKMASLWDLLDRSLWRTKNQYQGEKLRMERGEDTGESVERERERDRSGEREARSQTSG